MQKINYPLIVSDFDGTLVRSDGKIGEENKRAIERFLSSGGKFAISTGRMPYGILPRAKELGLQGMISCCQGSIILDIQSGRVISKGSLPLKSAIAACKQFEEMDLHIHAYTFKHYYANKDNQALKDYEDIVEGKAVRVLDKPMSVFFEELNEPIYKLLAILPPEMSNGVLQSLKEMGLEGCDFTKSADFFVEVIPKDYSKGTAVAFLAEYYSVPLEKTIAIGDQRNDMPMIEKAGVGVAVQNGDRALKEIADYVCERTNEENAVAEVIEKFGFYEEMMR